MTAFLDLCAEVGADLSEVRGQVEGAETAMSTGEPSELERRWYRGLREDGTPPYEIYDCDAYLGEAWIAWQHYSRPHLRNLARKGPELGEIKVAVDLGCGIGWSTGMLTKMFPDAEVYGTQLPNRQAAVARLLAEREGMSFHIVEELGELPAPTDLLFASEYFEHFEAPLDHLLEVLDATQPRTMVIANTFGPDAPGHFDTYRVGYEHLSPGATSRRFNDHLRRVGFQKVKTPFWNGRPAVWVRSSP